jgi:hypothetical protein
MSDRTAAGHDPGRFFFNYPVWNIFGTVCWCLTFGLDILQVWPRMHAIHRVCSRNQLLLTVASR